MVFLGFLGVGLAAAYLRWSDQIDDRISARIFGVLTVLVCLAALLMRRKKKGANLRVRTEDIPDSN
jgi:uncharacterized membrane protein YfcA